MTSSNKFHVFHQFQAVGHGTLFTGKLKDAVSNCRFTWIYDCGSSRPSRIKDYVNKVGPWCDGVIDLLVVSHFDNDHVNGLEQLIGSCRVGTLALPYIGFKDRLELVSSGNLSSDTAFFALDPIGYLYASDISSRVDSVLFVAGGGNDDEVSEQPIALPEPLGPNSPTLPDRRVGDPWENEQYPFFADDRFRALRVAVKVQSHKSPVGFRKFPWEFVFFNTAPDEKSKIKSGKTLQQIQDEVKSVLDKNKVMQKGVLPIAGWRMKLRQCYVDNFGDSAEDKNNLSLCVLARPNQTVKSRKCTYFAPYEHQDVDVLALDFKRAHGIFLTGDIFLSPSKVKEISIHYGTKRWSDVGVMQIPHHGSIHSWKLKTAAECHHDHSVFCVPNDSGSKPHPDVEIDLMGHGPVRANYNQSVTCAYHFDL